MMKSTEYRNINTFLFIRWLKDYAMHAAGMLL